LHVLQICVFICLPRRFERTPENKMSNSPCTLSDAMHHYLGNSPTPEVEDVTSTIRAMRDLSVKDCATILRVVSCKMAAQPKEFMSHGGSVVSRQILATGFLDQCADDLDEVAGLRSDYADQGSVEQMQDARRVR
jgi:hypothetical protein